MEVSFKAKPINIKQAEHLKSSLLKSKYTDIICHLSSDEDTIASARAIQWFLDKNKIPTRIIADNAEETYKFNKDIINLPADKIPATKADTILCIDFSSYSRVNKTIKSYIQKASRILCIDHHENGDIKDGLDVYVDTSAKSCAGIIVRLFEALKIKVPNKIAEQLYCGMIDDLRKNEYIKFNTGIEPIETNSLLNDKNSLSIYDSLKKYLSKTSKYKVVKHLNVLASLNKKEKNFKESLDDRLKYNSTKKFGYIIIPPDDKEWKSLGGDTKTTSAILGNFRKETLNRIPNLDSVAVFYPDKNGYRISIHSKGNNVLNLFNHIRKCINPEFSGGGHEERGGGTILTSQPNICKKWTDEIIQGAEDFYK